MKWQVDEVASWWNDKLMKWLVDEMAVDEMASWWNGKLMKMQVNEMASWFNCNMMKLQVDEITNWWSTNWWNGELVKWQVDVMTYWNKWKNTKNYLIFLRENSIYELSLYFNVVHFFQNDCKLDICSSLLVIL